MRLAGFLMACWMTCSVVVAQNVEKTAPSAERESLETEIFRLSTTGVGIVQRPALKVRVDVEPGAAETVEDFLRESGVPWPEGSNITYNVKTGTLIVTNTPANMVLVRELVRLWAQPAPQVEIEGRFVKILHAPRFEEYGEAQMISLLLASWTRFFPELGPPELRGLHSDRMLSVRAIMGERDFQFIWRAIDQKDWSDLLSAPRVTTISGQRAVVEVIPIKAGLGITLDVTPTVSADGKMIALFLKPEVAFVAEDAREGGEETAPVKSRSVSVTTTVHLRDGETVVLGGLMPERAADRAGTRSKLLIFVTARLIRPSSFSHGGGRQERLEQSWKQQ